MSEHERIELGMPVVIPQHPRLPHWSERPRKQFYATFYRKEDCLPACDVWEDDLIPISREVKS